MLRYSFQKHFKNMWQWQLPMCIVIILFRALLWSTLMPNYSLSKNSTQYLFFFELLSRVKLIQWPQQLLPLIRNITVWRVIGDTVIRIFVPSWKWKAFAARRIRDKIEYVTLFNNNTYRWNRRQATSRSHLST